MIRLALRVAYDGSSKAGWQHQDGHETVEGHLFHALRQNNISFSEWTKSSRTDRGVSSLDTLVSFIAHPPILPATFIASSLNITLPTSIRVLSLKMMADLSFHARRQCTSRTYHFLLPASVLDGSNQSFDEINSILSLFMGSHSWHSFTSDPVQRGSTEAIRSVSCFVVEEAPWEGFVRLVVTGTGFKRKQIRKMVGLGVAVIRGVADKSRIAIALSVQSSNAIVPVCPAIGLILASYAYEDVWSEEGEGEIRETQSNILGMVHKAMQSNGRDQWAAFLKSLNERNYKFTQWGEGEPAAAAEAKCERPRRSQQVDQSHVVISSLESYGTRQRNR